MQQKAHEGRHTIGGQFQNKGGGFALDDGGTQQPGHQQGHYPAHHGEQKHDRGRVIGKESPGQQQKHGQLGTAGHVGQREQGCQFFLGAAQGTGGHDTGNGATARNATRNDVRHDRRAVQAKKAEDTVHHVGHAGHVAAVFHKGDEHKHDENQRHKADHAAHARDDAVNNQRLRKALGQQGCAHFAQQSKAVFNPALRVCTQRKCYLKHQVQHANHDDRPKQGIGKHPVEFVGKGQAILARILCHDAIAQQAADKTVTIVGNNGFEVGVERAAHMADGLFAHGVQLFKKFGVGGAHFAQNFAVGFKHFQRNPVGHILAGKQARVFNALFHVQQHGVNVAAVRNAQGIAFAFLGKLNGHVHGLGKALARSGHHGHHRNTHQRGQALHINMDASGTGFVHHVAAKHHGHAHFKHLHRQQHVALKGRGIHHINDSLHAASRQFAPGHQLFHGIGGERIRARQVNQSHLIVAYGNVAFLAVYRYAGIVAHMLACASVAVEYRGLATVGIARKSYPQFAVCIKIGIIGIVELPNSTHARTSPKLCTD